MPGVDRIRRATVPGLLLILVLLAFPGALWGQETRPPENGLNLLLPTGAKAVGLGRAMTTSQGSESAFWNPAGLAEIQEGRFVVMRANTVVGEATAFSVILAKQPIGVLAFSYQLLDILETESTDEDNNVVGSFIARDHLGIVSFATQILPGTVGGINFKVYQERLTCRGLCPVGDVIATSYSLDLGIITNPIPDLPLRLGAMVAHAGPKLQFINAEQADPLPTRLRIAGSYEVLNHFVQRDDLELWTTVEAEERLRELGSPVLYLGAEFIVGQGDQIFIRSGYGQGQTGQPAGASVGFGLRYQQFEIGIGKSLSSTSLSSSESEPVHVSFTVLF